MNARPERLRRLAWLAIFAMLAMALVPSVSHALARLRGQSSWTEVCSTEGGRLVVLDAQGQPQAPTSSAAASLEHCPFCAPSCHGAALPPAPRALALRTDLSARAPALLLHAPRALPTWRSAQARAPPLFS